MAKNEASKQNIKKAILARKKIGLDKVVDKVVFALNEEETKQHVIDSFAVRGVEVKVK